MNLTIDIAVLLAVAAVALLRHRPHARKRSEEQLMVVIALVLGLLLAPTEVGQAILDVLRQLVDGLSTSGSG